MATMMSATPASENSVYFDANAASSEHIAHADPAAASGSGSPAHGGTSTSGSGNAYANGGADAPATSNGGATMPPQDEYAAGPAKDNAGGEAARGLEPSAQNHDAPPTDRDATTTMNSNSNGSPARKKTMLSRIFKKKDAKDDTQHQHQQPSHQHGGYDDDSAAGVVNAPATGTGHVGAHGSEPEPAPAPSSTAAPASDHLPPIEPTGFGGDFKENVDHVGAGGSSQSSAGAPDHGAEPIPAYQHNPAIAPTGDVKDRSGSMFTTVPVSHQYHDQHQQNTAGQPGHGATGSGAAAMPMPMPVPQNQGTPVDQQHIHDDKVAHGRGMSDTMTAVATQHDAKNEQPSAVVNGNGQGHGVTGGTAEHAALAGGAAAAVEPAGPDTVMHQRAETAQSLLPTNSVKKITKTEAKDAKKLIKVLNSETKTQAKTLASALSDLAHQQKLHKTACDEEAHALKAHAYATKAEHKLHAAYLSAKAKYEQASGEVRAKDEQLAGAREHARKATEALEAKNLEVEELRKQKAVDDREREARKKSLEDMVHNKTAPV